MSLHSQNCYIQYYLLIPSFSFDCITFGIKNTTAFNTALGRNRQGGAVELQWVLPPSKLHKFTELHHVSTVLQITTYIVTQVPTLIYQPT